MQRTLGRRPLFFGILALMAAALIPATPAEFRWTCWLCVGLGAFWAVLLAIEDLTTPRGPRVATTRGGPRARDLQSPFGPPPPPGAGQ